MIRATHRYRSVLEHIQIFSSQLFSEVAENHTFSGFPLGLEKWEGIFQSGNVEQTGKVRENNAKYWKSQGIQPNVIYYL